MLSKNGSSSSYRKKSVIVTLIFLMASLLIPSAEAQTPPSPPHAFYGTVTIEGNPVPDGFNVTAEIVGVFSVSTMTSGSKYGYDPTFKVLSDDPETTVKDGGVNGDTVKFYIEGLYIVSYTFKSASVTELNLILTDFVSPIVTINLVTTPTSVPTQTITGTFEETFIETIVAESPAGSVNATIDAEAGTYSAADVPLNEGENPITVTATDLAGNIGIFEIMVVLDTTPPTISDIQISDITTASARIAWITDELSTSQVEYGVTISYGSLTTLDPALKTSHSVGLAGLEEGTTYHFRVVSTDEEENTAHSGDHTFTTAATDGGNGGSPPLPMPPSPTNEAPVADAGPNQKAWIGSRVYFDGSKSEDPDGTIVEYHWFPGDSSYKPGVMAIHIYEEAGVYTASLQVTDNNGATNTDNCTIKISEPPAQVSNKFVERVQTRARHVVDAMDEANTTVTLDTTNDVTVTILKYEGNPQPLDPIPAMALPNYVDVEVSDPDAVVWPIYVEMFYTDEEIEGLDEHTFGIYYWFNGTWQRCSDTGVDTERNVVWAYMTAEEASGSPILIAGTHAIITPSLPPFLDYLTVTPSELELGDNVTVSLEIMNPNDEAIGYGFDMEIGELILNIWVDLGAYESKTVSRTITPTAIGTYNVTVYGMTGNFTVNAPLKPADFVVSDLSITPEETEPVDEVTISVLVTNIGEETGNYTITLDLPAGPYLREKTVSLEGGESERVEFEVSRDIEGTYDVTVDGLTGSFTVKAPPKPAEFELSNFNYTSEIQEGEPLRIYVDIANIGELPGETTIIIKIDGAILQDLQSLFQSGPEEVFSQVWTSYQPFEVGTHTINLDGFEGTFNVIAEPVPFWTTPEFIMGVIVIIVGIVAIYAWRRGSRAER